MKKKGYALLFTLVFMIPITIIIVGIIDIVSTDYMVVCNRINSQQSYYNAEAGMDYIKNDILRNGYGKGVKYYYLKFDNGCIRSISPRECGNNYICVRTSVYYINNEKRRIDIVSNSNYIGYNREIESEVEINTN